MDIAALAFSVDSTDTLKAVNALDSLRQTAAATGKSQQDLAQQSDYLSTSMSNQFGAAARLSRQLAEAGASFEDLIGKADRARKALDGSFASFEAWDAAQQKVEALGRAYGTTARGLDAYLQTAAQMSLSSTQAAAAAQRLTQALEGQTAAAAGLRQVLSNNGVSIGDLQSDQIDTLLTRIKAAFQRAPDGAQRTSDLRQVLGTFDPDVLGAFTRPNYVPILDQQAQRRQQAESVETARQFTAVADRTRQIGAENTEYDDLRGSIGAFSRFTPDQIAQIRGQAEPGSALSRDGRASRQGELEFLRTVRDAKLPSDLSTGTDLDRAIANARQPQIQLGPFRFQEDGALGSVARRLRYLNSGQVSANDLDIENRFHEEADSDTSFLQLGGYPRRLFASLIRSDQNLLGTYTPSVRPPPPPNPLDQAAVGDQLSAYGDSTIQRYQQSQQLLKSLGIFNGLGDTSAGARGEAARGVFTSAYGAQDGGQNYEAALARAKASQRTILDDTGDLDQANVALGLSQQSIGDAAKSRAFISYAQQRRVPASLLAGKSLSELLDPDNATALGLPAGLQRSFGRTNEANQKASANEFDRNQALDLADLGQQANVTGAGGTALQDLITYQQSYNRVLKETSDAKEADRRATAELDKADAQRLVTIRSMLSEQDRANAIEKKRVEGSGLGGYGGQADELRGAIGYVAQIEADLETLRQKYGAAFTEDDQWKYRDGRQQQLGLQGLSSAQDRTAGTAQELNNQQKLLSVAGERQSVQEKMNRDIQVEMSFQADLAKAVAGNDAERVAKVRSLIEETKRLKDAIAEANLEAKAFQLGRDANQATSDSQYRRSLPRSERARADFLQPVNELERQIVPGSNPSGDVASGNMNATQRAFLNTIAQLEGGDYNRRYSPDGKATFSDFSRHPEIYEPGPAGPSSAAGRYMITKQTWDEQAAKLKLNDISPTNQDTAAWDLGVSRYKKLTGGDLESDLNSGDPATLAKISEKLHGTWVTTNSNFGADFQRNLATTTGAPAAVAFDTARAARNAQFDEQNKNQAQDLQETDQIRRGGLNAELPFRQRGDAAGAALAGAGNYDPIDPNGALKARLRQRQVNDDFQRQAVDSSAQTDIQIETNLRLADAYGKSTKAVQDLQDKMKVEQEQRQLGIKNIDEEARLRGLLQARITDQTAATEQAAKKLRDRNSDQTALNRLGPFASEQAIGREQVNIDVANYKKDHPEASDESIANFTRDRKDEQTVKEKTQQVNEYRQAWQSAQSAAFEALNNVILNGAKAGDVVGSLAKSLANIGLNVLEKGVSTYLGNQLGGIFGHATGDAWLNGQQVRMFASGGLIDRPTYFASGGTTNVAGEMGTEAIMPLKRMPNGDLGVSTGGGGRGGVTVNAPITINGNGGGGSSGGGYSQQDLSMMQAQLSEAVRQAVVRGIADEKRAGGSLYG